MESPRLIVMNKPGNCVICNKPSHEYDKWMEVYVHDDNCLEILVDMHAKWWRINNDTNTNKQE